MNAAIGYLILRLALGINIFLHGWVRIKAGRKNFAQSLNNEFEGTELSPAMVKAFGLYLPAVELVTGILLITGFASQAVIIIGTVTMFSLIIGKSLKADWQTVTFQMLYVAYYAALQLLLCYNEISIDHLLQTH